MSLACATFYLTLSACFASFPNRTNDSTLTFINSPGEDPPKGRLITPGGPEDPPYTGGRLIRTARGRTIYVSHDTNLPRPYSRINLVQGTRGIFQGYPDRVYVEGRSPEHRWEESSAYLAEYDHPLWTDLTKNAEGAGHDGMDYLEDYRLVKCLREGLPTDMNVYDAAAMSAVVHLSERSNERRSATMDFPDFTRGRWKTNAPLEIVRA